MLHWRDASFQTLRDVASTVRSAQKWPDYVTFCEEYERGLRASAFGTLDRFIASIEQAPFSERREFVEWLLRRTDGRDGLSMVMPHPLHRRVIEPTLMEWTQVDSRCSESYMWLGGYDNSKPALQLNPKEDRIRPKLITKILQLVNFATHELPTGYIGSPSNGIAAFGEAQSLSLKLTSEAERQELATTVEEYKTQSGLIYAPMASSRNAKPPTHTAPHAPASAASLAAASL